MKKKSSTYRQILSGRFLRISELYPTLISGNSFRGVLRIALESGFGGECASIPEALHALSVGFPKDKVVFDSPCKTKVITNLP